MRPKAVKKSDQPQSKQGIPMIKSPSTGRACGNCQSAKQSSAPPVNNTAQRVSLRLPAQSANNSGTRRYHGQYTGIKTSQSNRSHPPQNMTRFSVSASQRTKSR